MNIVMYPKVLLGAAGYLKQQLTKRFSVISRSVIIHKTSLCWVGLFRAIILVAATTICTTVRETNSTAARLPQQQDCFSPHLVAAVGFFTKLHLKEEEPPRTQVTISLENILLSFFLNFVIITL